MLTNGITVPDAGSTSQYIADPVGGWMYVVTTTTVVEQKKLEDIQQELSDAQAVLVSAQAKIDQLAPQVATFEKSLALAVPAVSLPPTPDATSTPVL